MDSMHLFLHQHAIAHSAEMAGEGECEWSFQDAVLEGFSDEQMRLRPQPGMNSVAWLIWHMARTEDVVMNLLVADRPQVLHEGDWLSKLNPSRADIGTGMGDEDVAGISTNLDIAALRAYRVAVGRRTREIVQTLRPEELRESVDPSRIAGLLSEGVLIADAHSLAEFWKSKTKAFLLAMPATGHNFAHLGEAINVKRRLGL